MRESGLLRRLTWVLRIRMTTLSRTCTNGSTGSRKKAGRTWSNVPIPPSFRLKAENRAEWLRKNSFILKTPPATASLRRKEIFRLFLEDRITGVVWSKLFRRLLPGCSAPLEVRLPSSFTSGEDTLYVSRAIARCRSVALTSEKLYHYGLGGPQSVSSRNRKAETRPASYYAVFEMLTREKLREGVLGSNRTAYMNYIVPLLFPDNEMPAGRLRHWAELWREADITSEHVCGMPREQRAYLEAALAGRWIYLRLLQCFWKFKTARRHMFRLRFSKNGIDTLQILGYTLYSAKKLPRSSL